MLDKLEESLALLPPLLDKPEVWESLIVNRRKPFTYRVFTQLPSGLRLCLHKFDACHTDEAFLHPHPWPGAFIILSGSYKMQVGYSKDRISSPDSVATLVLSKYSSYEILNPLTWHSVTPLETTYTIMVNGEPWEEPHKDVRRTKGKDLDKMADADLKEHLFVFKHMVNFYLTKDKAI